MTESYENLVATYGPEAAFSEHKRGEAITYRMADGNAIASGTIIWVCAGGMVGSKDMSLHYIVAPDEPTGFIDVVFPGDVIVGSEQAQEEPMLQRCPYCPGLHYDVEQCPLNPKNRWID